MCGPRGCAGLIPCAPFPACQTPGDSLATQALKGLHGNANRVCTIIWLFCSRWSGRFFPPWAFHRKLTEMFAAATGLGFFWLKVRPSSDPLTTVFACVSKQPLVNSVCISSSFLEDYPTIFRAPQFIFIFVFWQSAQIHLRKYC